MDHFAGLSHPDWQHPSIRARDLRLAGGSEDATPGPLLDLLEHAGTCSGGWNNARSAA